jgi:dolichol-phosphate mannosyltransferase
VFYRLMRKMASPEIPLDAGEFRLLDRKAVTFLKSLTERTRFLRGLTVWPGLRQAKIRIERAARASGKTNYNFRRSLLVAIDGLTTFSLVPLRAVAVTGLIILAASALAGVALGAMGRWRAAAIASIWFLGGVQLLFLGVVAEYIGRIFVEVQNRPLYWVDYELGFPPRDRATAP